MVRGVCTQCSCTNMQMRTCMHTHAYPFAHGCKWYMHACVHNWSIQSSCIFASSLSQVLLEVQRISHCDLERAKDKHSLGGWWCYQCWWRKVLQMLGWSFHDDKIAFNLHCILLWSQDSIIAGRVLELFPCAPILTPPHPHWLMFVCCWFVSESKSDW